VAFRAEKEAAARVAASLAEEVEAARDEVRQVLSALQSAPTVKKATEAARQLERWSLAMEKASRVAGSQAAAAPEAAPGGVVEPGARVRVASLGQEGEVLEVLGDEAVIRLGSLRMRRPVSDLLPLRGKAAPVKLARARDERLRSAEEARPAPLSSSARRLDVRGMRVDELLREVDGFLDRLYAEGATDAVVLHGHGTGALKHALREHLERSPYVGSHKEGGPHEGGGAVTVICFRR